MTLSIMALSITLTKHDTRHNATGDKQNVVMLGIAFLFVMLIAVLLIVILPSVMAPKNNWYAYISKQ
jgi:hypothetical protein